MNEVAFKGREQTELMLELPPSLSESKEKVQGREGEGEPGPCGDRREWGRSCV